MNNFENIRVPQYSKTPKHLIKQSTYFIASELPPIGDSAKTDKKLSIGDKVIVLEECTGFNGLWAKIRIQDSDGKYTLDGYVLQSSIKAIDENTVSIDCNIEDRYLPKYSALPIEWRDQPVDTVFYDEKRALYCVLYDTKAEAIAGSNDDEKKKFVEQLMTNALFSGLQIIFKDRGKKYDLEYITNLQNLYYLFGASEAIDFMLRDCSTLRVLVTIPARYCESYEIEVSEIDSNNAPVTNVTSGTDSTTTGDNKPKQENKPKYADIIFNNYSEYKNFFGEMQFVLEKAKFIYKSREWFIEPSNVNINLDIEKSNLLSLKDKIDLLLISNIPPNLASEVVTSTLPILKNTPEEERSFASYASDVISALPISDAVESLQEIAWEGNLTIKIDIDNKKIAYMEFFTLSGIKIPLNVGVLKFLDDNIVKSKTSINYILERYYSAFKYQYYVALSEKLGEKYKFGSDNRPSAQEIADAVSSVKMSEKFKKYETIFQVPIMVKEIPSITPSNLVQDDFIEYGRKFDSVFSSTIPSEDELPIQTFIEKYHYPTVNSIKPRPLDITKCVKDNLTIARNLKNNKLPSTIKTLKKIRETDFQKQRSREGNEFFKSFDDYPKNIKNRNLRILLGVEKPPPSYNAYQKLNTFYIPALKSLKINTLLAELVKCQMMNMDPATFAAMINKYNNVKNFLEQLAFATLCNPYLTNGLKKLNGFRIPQIPVYNPNKNLADEITKAVINIAQEVLIIGVRKMLESSLKACLKDKNKETNPGASENADDLADALNNAGDDTNINDTLDDIFGLGNNKDPNMTQQEKDALDAARSAAKEKLKNVFDKLLCTLTTKELCDLLKGRSVELEVYELIRNIVKASEPSIADKLSTPDDIKNFFSRMGLSIDLRICSDIDNASNPIPSNPLCDDGTLNDARRKLLDSKGLTPDLVDSILNDIKAQEAKNLEDILKFLDSDQPFDLTNVPSALCKKAPDGSQLPPSINLTPAIDSFKSILNTMFKSTYDTFDSEALEWSKTSYSVSSSGPQLLYFDEEQGRINFDKTAIDNIANSSNPPGDSNKNILPAFLFNDFLSDSKYTSNSKYDFYAELDGHKQQELDANIINNSLINSVTDAENSLRAFLGNFISSMGLAAIAGGVIEITKFIGGADPTQVNNYTGILNNLSLFDNFMRNTSGDISSSPYNLSDEQHKKFLDSFGTNHEATVLLFQETGATVYIKIMEFIAEQGNESQLKSLIDKIDRALLGNGTQRGIGATLKQQLKDAIDKYAIVKKYYKAILNTKLNYPKYELQFVENYSSSNPIQKNTDLHDRFNLSIKKNSSAADYIHIMDYEDADIQVTEYVTTKIGISNLNEDKKKIFAKYLISLNPNLSAIKEEELYVTYDSIKKLMLLSIGDKVKSSQFLSKVKIADSQTKTKEDANGNDVTTTIPDSYSAFTDNLVLVLPDSPTPEQKICGIRPHYLDIDSIIGDAVRSKEASACGDVVLNQKILNNEKISSEELEKQETNDTQNIMLTAVYRLALRVYLHDIVLRGIGIFGYFDPQVLRSDALFVDYLSSTVESEIRAIDDRFFKMMTGFFLKQYNFSNSQNPIADTPAARRQVLKNVIRDELKKAVLPKLSKRITDDTNKKLKDLNIMVALDPIKLKFIDNGKSLSEVINYFKRSQVTSYVGNKNIVTSTVEEIKIFEESNVVKMRLGLVNYVIYNGTLKEFNYSKPEFKLLFEFLFPVKRYITLFFITSVLATSTRKQILDAFKGTKKGIRKLAIAVQTNGQPVVPSLNNPQDVMNADSSDDLWWFIVKMLLTTPIKIAKGLIEGMDPNVMLSSTAYKAGKSLDKELSSYIIPAIGVPLGFWFFSPFMFNPFNLIYYGTGMWYEDANSNGKNKAEKQKEKYVEDLLNNSSLVYGDKCLLAANHSDILKFNDLGYYVNISNQDAYSRSAKDSSPISREELLSRSADVDIRGIRNGARAAASSSVPTKPKTNKQEKTSQGTSKQEK